MVVDFVLAEIAFEIAQLGQVIDYRQFYPYNLRKILHVLFRDTTAGDTPDFRGSEIFHYVREFLGVRPTAKMVFDF